MYIIDETVIQFDLDKFSFIPINDQHAHHTKKNHHRKRNHKITRYNKHPSSYPYSAYNLYNTTLVPFTLPTLGSFNCTTSESCAIYLPILIYGECGLILFAFMIIYLACNIGRLIRK